MRGGEESEPVAAEALAREYAAALREYLSTGSEAALTHAYELGRRAAGGGLGLLELVLLHHEALLGLAPGGAGERSPLATAGQFLAESLSPFEMTLRSYRANARLLGLSETLAERNAEIDRAREQLRTILDATTAVIYLKSAEGRYLYVNRRFQEVFGVEGAEVLGKLDAEVLPAPVAATLHHDDRRVLEARAPHELEEVVPAADGPRTYLSLKFPLLDGAGAPYGICCVATDITERKRAEEAQRLAREAAARQVQLEQELEARDRFLAITSHELKTPLTSLELQVAGLQRLARSSAQAPLSGERVQAKCQVIVDQVERLTVLINNLIDVGRMASGRLELERGPVDLVEVVAAVLGRARENIARSASRIDWTAPDGPVVGSWDRRRLEAVVANLLSNALKFGEGRPIAITVQATPAQARLTVRDHGIGISAEDQRRIFERFERAVSERHFGGFGVGLWVARQAVEAHGGRIDVHSPQGAGSEFTVELPRG